MSDHTCIWDLCWVFIRDVPFGNATMLFFPSSTRVPYTHYSAERTHYNLFRKAPPRVLHTSTSGMLLVVLVMERSLFSRPK